MGLISEWLINKLSGEFYIFKRIHVGILNGVLTSHPWVFGQNKSELCLQHCNKTGKDCVLSPPC